jgi:hypothetical protein
MQRSFERRAMELDQQRWPAMTAEARATDDPSALKTLPIADCGSRRTFEVLQTSHPVTKRD